MAERFDDYGFEYSFGGKKWLIDVCATSPEDARERLRAAGDWGQCLGRQRVSFSLMPIVYVLLGMPIGAALLLWMVIA